MLLLAVLNPMLSAAEPDLRAVVAGKVAAEYPSLEALYKHLHANPELSLMEEKTAARVAAEFRTAGFEVTEKFGGNGVVAVFKNGDGPTLLIRTDLDGLPIEEETGLAYASKARMKDFSGREVPVMHGCGHDIHMTVITGTARILATLREHWSGTLVLIGQTGLLVDIERVPALEERLSVKCLLRRLTQTETMAYIQHRLQAAGSTRPIFSDAALEVIHQHALGVPRRINRLCDLALLVGFAEEASQIDAAQIEAISEELLTSTAD